MNRSFFSTVLFAAPFRVSVCLCVTQSLSLLRLAYNYDTHSQLGEDVEQNKIFVVNS